MLLYQTDAGFMRKSEVFELPTMTQAGYTPPQDAPKRQPPKAHSPKKPKKRKKKGGIGTAGIVSLIIFLIAVLIGSATLFLYAKTEPYSDTFLPGTSVSGYELGGLTAQDGAQALERLTQSSIDAWHCDLTYGGQTYTLTAQNISLSVDTAATLDPLWQLGRGGNMLTRYLQMLSLQAEPQASLPVLTYDMDAVDALLERAKAEIDSDPVDATVGFLPGNSVPFRFTDEREGRRLSTDALRERIEASILSLTPVTETLKPEAVRPQVYRAELEGAIVLRSRIVVPLSGSEAAQANAALAAAALNGLRVDAGETLSFNQTVGLRTSEAGYQAAEEPAYGQNVSGVGGGVCQVSTALYRLALLGGLEIGERNAAVYPVDYCDVGQEAAVSDQGLDLKIVNSIGMPVFLTARVYADGDGQTMELQLIGLELDESYTLVSETETIAPPEEPIYVRDSEGRYAAYSDERIPVGEPMPGYRVTVRLISETDEKIVSQDEYDAIPQIIYVGVSQRP